MTQTATTPTRDTAAEDPVPRRLWRVAGGLALAHVVLLFTGLSLQNAALFQEGRAGIESSYVDGNLTRSVTGGYIELIGFVLMIPVIVLLARGLGRRTAAGRWAAQTALVGGIGYLVLTFSPGMAAGAVSMHAAQNGVGLDTAWVMNNLRVVTYVVSLMFLGVHAIGVGIAALSDRFSPRLVGIGGLLSGAVLMTAPLLLGVNLQDIPTLVWLLWWVALGVQMIRRNGR